MSDEAAAGKSGEERTLRPRFKPPQLWDDQGFRKRMADLASKKGLSVRAAMSEIGLTGEFAYRGADSRPTNLLMVIADYFQIPPAELAGWVPPPEEAVAPPEEPEEPAPPPEEPAAPPEEPAPPPKVSQENEQLVTKLAEIFSQQTLKMLFITLAVVRPELDPASIAALARVARHGFEDLDKDQISSPSKK